MFGQVRTGYVKLDLVRSVYVSLVQVRFGYARLGWLSQVMPV
jgi:hypothetical protein